MSRLMSATRFGRRAPVARRRNRTSALRGLPAGVFRVLGTLALGTLVAWALVLRFRPRPLLDRVRQFNKRYLNPLMLKLAGKRYWYASSVEHVGRRSGRTYVTPVVAEPYSDGFVVPLPYGSDVDWLRNVLATGTCTIKWHGDEFPCEKPEVVALETVSESVPRRIRRAWGVFGIRDALTVKVAAPSPSAR